MRRRLPPPNWLRSFEAAARHLSFTHAAKELNVSQSAISQQVKLLEHFLQQPLFHRYPRRLELTDAGKAYLPAVRDAFERLRASTEELFGTAKEQTLTLRVNVAFAALWLAPRLGHFLSHYPKLNIRIMNTIWLDDFIWENIDVDIRFGRGQWPGLNATRLSQDTLFPLCSPQLLEYEKPLQQLQDLAHHTLLVTVGNEDGWPQWLAFAQASDINTWGSVQCDTSMIAYEMAVAGAGIVLGRSLTAERYLRSRRLIKPFTFEMPTEETFFLVTPEYRTEQPRVSAFRHWLLNELHGVNGVNGVNGGNAISTTSGTG